MPENVNTVTYIQWSDYTLSTSHVDIILVFPDCTVLREKCHQEFSTESKPAIRKIWGLPLLASSQNISCMAFSSVVLVMSRTHDHFPQCEKLNFF